MTSLDRLKQALHAAQRSWSGCDWNTDYGSGGINLRGLSSRQASLAAKATRGEESDNWRSACEYLHLVERDAHQAAGLASDAVEAWRLGDSRAAMALLEEAISLEARYREPIAYPELRTLMQSMMQEVPR